MTTRPAWRRGILATAFLALAAQSAVPAGEGGMPQVGEPAPEFAVIDQERNEISLASFRGEKHVVLAFYPLAFTGG